MKRPLHVLSAFIVCLLMVCAGMSWLTVKVVQLDRAQAEATLDADFEGDVRLALRRMDMKLADILATESAWPHFAYQPFYWPDPAGQQIAAAAPVNNDGQTTDDTTEEIPAAPQPSTPEPVASPLLNPAAKYVNLYFQIDADNNIFSPNVPPDDQQHWAVANGATAEQIKTYGDRLTSMQELVDRNDIAQQLPNVEPLIASVAQNRAEPPPQVDPSQMLAMSEGAQGDPFDVANAPAQIDNSADPQLAQQPAQQTALQGGVKGRISQEAQTLRGNLEYRNRKRQYEQQAFNWDQRRQQQMLAGSNDPQLQKVLMAADASIDSTTVLEGRSRAFWVDSRLLLARRLKLDGKPVVQGCWLDWQAIKHRLAAEVSDLLPQCELVPVHSEADADMARMLATLPAEIVVDSPGVESWSYGQELTPIQLALLAAWGCLLLAALAVSLLLGGVVSLSERRAAFVSAVTHELRTPLTTFRMYAEMLAEGMVPDQDRRQRYLDTLKTEADRLYHLVENVLSYARLERGRARSALTEIRVGDVLSGMQQRLASRTDQANMQLVLELADGTQDRALLTDVGGVEQILVNLVDNACKYAESATDRSIRVRADYRDGKLRLSVRDHGPGIPRGEMRRLFQPFTKSAEAAAHSAPGVGLGLALCRRMARQLGGSLQLETPPDGGARFVLTLPAK